MKGLYPPSEEQQTTFQILSARSPDQRYNLIFDWYLVIEGSGDEVDISGEPDSAPLLLDHVGGTSNQFTSCGPSGAFYWGVWLSSTSFALAGGQSEEDLDRQVHAFIKIYSLADSTERTYVTRPVSVEVGNRYRAAWEAWVNSRFRAINKRTRRS